MASRHPHGVRLADRCRARSASLLGANSACDRHFRQPTLHARCSDRRQAHHDEEHGGSHGNAERGFRRNAGQEGIFRAGVCDRRQGRLAHVFKPDWKLNLLTDGLGESWRITQCGMKAFPTEALTHTPISAVLDLVKNNDLRPDDVEKIQIRSLTRAADILADPSKYDPHTKETADHSLPYVIAAALVDRQVTPVQFTMEKIMDPRFREQLNKVEVVADPEIEKVFPALQTVIVQIQTRDGRALQKQLDFPKGDRRNPLTDQEIEEKFASLADGVLSKPTQNKVKETVWRLERVGSVSDLMALMESDIRKTQTPKLDGKAPSRSKNSKNRRSVLVYHRKPS